MPIFIANFKMYDIIISQVLSDIKDNYAKKQIFYFTFVRYVRN